MQFSLLGPLEVSDQGRRLDLGAIKQRSLLALLLLNANEVVSTDRLIAELWGDSPPATVAKSVQIYVSRLRKEIPDGRLATRPPGYVLRVDSAELDLEVFERLRREARREASRLLADASLMVQRTAGVRAEPLPATPGRGGVMALADGAGLLVVGLSDRWREEGLGRVRAELALAPPAPTVFVRRGPRPGGLAPDGTRTRFGWSLTGAGA